MSRTYCCCEFSNPLHKSSQKAEREWVVWEASEGVWSSWRRKQSSQATSYTRSSNTVTSFWGHLSPSQRKPKHKIKWNTICVVFMYSIWEDDYNSKHYRHNVRMRVLEDANTGESKFLAPVQTRGHHCCFGYTTCCRAPYTIRTWSSNALPRTHACRTNWGHRDNMGVDWAVRCDLKGGGINLITQTRQLHP